MIMTNDQIYRSLELSLLVYDFRELICLAKELVFSNSKRIFSTRKLVKRYNLACFSTCLC